MPHPYEDQTLRYTFAQADIALAVMRIVSDKVVTQSDTGEEILRNRILTWAAGLSSAFREAMARTNTSNAHAVPYHRELLPRIVQKALMRRGSPEDIPTHKWYEWTFEVLWKYRAEELIYLGARRRATADQIDLLFESLAKAWPDPAKVILLLAPNKEEAEKESTDDL